MTFESFVICAMFAIVGGTLASGGMGIQDKPTHFILIMLCMAIVQNLSKN
jgi:hypothetical protein